MQSLRVVFFGTAIMTLLTSAITVGADKSSPAPPSATDFAQAARAFIEQNCISCHGAKKAKAGFRIDQLGFDFSAPRVADQWKKVSDRINAGEMPPESKPRPDAKQTDQFVGWVNVQLHELERAARTAGGRIVMRRLNRDELANTISDLLKIDIKIVAPIVEELPGDGKAEGFDRMGTALFFDQSQIERSLAAAEKIARLAIVTEPPKLIHHFFDFPWDKKSPPPAMIECFPSSKHLIPNGALDKIVKPEGITHIQGYPTWRREEDGWGSVSHYSINSVVKCDGYYRFRIKGKVDNRSRTIPNKFRLQYGMDSPLQTEKEVTIDPSGVTEVTMFLRGPDASGEVKGPQVFDLLWNHTHKAVIPEPKFYAAISVRGA